MCYVTEALRLDIMPPQGQKSWALNWTEVKHNV